MKEYQRCSRCVMDNRSDNTIVFNAQGYCNYCTKALVRSKKTYFPNEDGKKKLDVLLNKIKESSKGKKYDCIMGLSGGLDSSYLAYLGHTWGLRVLAVHIDDGYDTKISKNNLKKLISATGFDFETITPDAKQFNGLTLAYMKAGVPNVAVPQDNVLFAFLYKKMKEYDIKYFLSGSNFALESILQKGNTHYNTDVTNIKDIHKKYGFDSIDKLELISTVQKVIDKKLHHIKTETPLNYIDYNRDRAFIELENFCNFQYYGRKHLENALTAFVQLVWLPEKFGVDKRTSHLSSMIISNQMTREEALQELKEPLYDTKIMDEYITLIKKNLGITDAEFEYIMKAPTHQHTEFKTEEDMLLYKLFMKAYNFIRSN